MWPFRWEEQQSLGRWRAVELGLYQCELCCGCRGCLVENRRTTAILYRNLLVARSCRRYLDQNSAYVTIRQAVVGPFLPTFLPYSLLSELDMFRRSKPSWQKMAEVVVEPPFNGHTNPKKPIVSHIPNIEIEGVSNDDNDEYSTLKKLQGYLEYAAFLECWRVQK